MSYRIVRTSNFDDERVNEEFVSGLGELSNVQAQHICKAINEKLSGEKYTYWWKVVENPYKLRVYDPNA